MAEVALKRDLADYNGMIDEYNKQAGKYTRAGKVYNQAAADYNKGIEAYNGSWVRTTNGSLALYLPSRGRGFWNYAGYANRNGKTLDPNFSTDPRQVPGAPYYLQEDANHHFVKWTPSPLTFIEHYAQRYVDGKLPTMPGPFTAKPPDIATKPAPLEEGPRTTISQGNRFEGKYGWADAERGGLVDDARRIK